MFDVIYDEKDSTATLMFDGSLTIRNITNVRNALICAAEKANKIIVEHDSVEDFDVSYLQLLIAAMNSLKTSGKKLVVEKSTNKAFQKFLEDSGCLNLQSFFEETEKIGDKTKWLKQL